MMRTRPNRFVVFLGLTQIFSWASTYYLPAAVGKTVAHDFGVSETAVLGGFSIALLIGGLLAPAIGRRIQKAGGRGCLTFGSLCSGVGLLVLSQAHELILWYSGWAVLGFGMALGLFNVVFSVMAQIYGHEAKGLILKITLISGFATLLWPVTDYLIEHYSWRVMLVFYALPYFFVLAPLYYVLVPQTSGVQLKTEVKEVDIKASHFVFYALAAFAILRTLIGTSVSVHIFGVFESMSLSSKNAAWIAAWIGPAQTGGRLVELLVGRKVSAIGSAIFWAAILPGALFALMTVGAPAAMPFALAYGMSNGMATISLSVLLMTYYDIKSYPSLVAKISLPTLLMQAAAPLLSATLLNSFPITKVLAITCALGVMAVFCLVLVQRLGRPLPAH